MKPGARPPVVSSVGLVEYTSQRLPAEPADSALAPALLMKFAAVLKLTPALTSIEAPAAMVRLPVPACMTTAPAPLMTAFTLIALKAVSVSVPAGLLHVSGALTLMSPAPALCTPAPEAVVAVVSSVTLVPVFNDASIVVAAAALMARLMGAITHEPPGPATTFAPLARATTAPEVSIEPLGPPA